VAGRSFELFEPRIDAVPPGRHEVDEQSEIVDTGVALGEHLLLESLEPMDRVVEQPTDLGEALPHDRDLAPQTLLDRLGDPVGKPGLELHGGRGERLDLETGTLERRVDPARAATFTCFFDMPFRAFQRVFIHGRQGYSGRRMRSSELDYQLPPELIAQHPAERRDASRLLVFRRETGEIRHRVFVDLPEEIGDELVVVNDTRVIPARLRLRRATGGAVELLLLERIDGPLWEALARPSRRLRPGERLALGSESHGSAVELVAPIADGRWQVRLEGEPAGETPLPPYIHAPLSDRGRYQTVYADEAGSAAAPTAGLHFTHDLLNRLDVERVTLHVGLDTFRPLTTETVDEHVLHGERYRLQPAAWNRIRGAERVLAVGTTTVRVLETVVRTGDLEGRTSLFVTPGFEFRRVNALLTNFHLPRSTLLALVMAFAGVEETRELYRLAIADRYRFYSFGDAMLVL
jgi:S-adenosylmethionine:tRNA ribosyltransferase-isomerase